MNKKLFCLIIAFLLLIPVSSVFATAPDPIHSPATYLNGNRQMYSHEITWGADDTTAAIADITIPASDLKKYKGTYLYRIETDPGATAPTDGYDIVINDEYGYDVTAGKLADRSDTDTEYEKVLIPIFTQLTIVFTNNAVNSATGKIVLIFVW